MTKITWLNQRRRLGDLIPYDKNPRQLTEKQYDDLKASLGKFNLAEIPAINTDNKIIAGHQRIKILRELEGADYEIDVRVPSRELSKEEYEEYLIRSNKNTGEWDFDILANGFDTEDLVEWGFQENEFAIGADFEPVGEDEQGKLDELKPKIVVCPECGKEFDANKTDS